MRYGPSENLLRAGVGTMVVFGTLMLCVGERSVVLLLVSLLAVVFSVYLTDVTKMFRFSQPVANAVALGVVAVSAYNTAHVDRAGQLITVANLQSYLQFVLLFQAKTARVYWQLALLSLGQLAIASTLVPGPLFGGMLLIYLIVGVLTFTLLLVHGEAERVAGAPALAGAVAQGGSNGSWLASHAPILDGGSADTSCRMVRGMIEQGGAIVSVTLATAAVLFFLIPRWNIQNREVPTDEPYRTVGFSKTITLGALGEVVQNPDIVMRIQFFHGHSMRPFKLADEPLFRGSVVTRYQDGAWTQAQSPSIVALSTEPKPPYVRQKITVEPLDVSELFCVIPAFGLQSDPRLKLDASCEQLVRQEDYRSQRMDFEVVTTGIRDDRQSRFLPCSWPLRQRALDQLLQTPEVEEGQPEPLSALRETTARVLREKQIDASDPVAAARALCDYLRFSGRFSYSLEPQARELGWDPLEDFVTLHHSGHCEYFAGALVMMLRSLDIPARVAIGFKGGEWNPLGMYYQVQQLHAHAWVEVYLQQKQIPADAFAEDESPPPAAWLVLDPTVASQDGDTTGQIVGALARLRQYVDYAQVLWANYVVGLNAKRQQQGIYGPVRAGTEAAIDNLFGAEVWNDRLHALANSRVGTFWEWYRRHWFDWRGGLVAAGASLVLISCYLALRSIRRGLRRLGLIRGGLAAHEVPTLEMYRRLEAALAREGLTRHPGQTAFEFALAAGGSLAESMEHRRLASLPRRVVESFYRVRFGGRTLDNLEADAVEHALADLERSLGNPR